MTAAVVKHTDISSQHTGAVALHAPSTCSPLAKANPPGRRGGKMKILAIALVL